MTTNPAVVDIAAGHAGQISGFTRAAWKQRIRVTLLRPDGSEATSATFLGQGEGAPMLLEADDERVWYFDTIPTAGYVFEATVEHQKPGSRAWSESSVLFPITVSTPATSGTPSTVVTVILSDDTGGVDFNDATLSLIQWKF